MKSKPRILSFRHSFEKLSFQKYSFRGFRLHISRLNYTIRIFINAAFKLILKNVEKLASQIICT